ncbi:FAST kinase domain-containing protein 5, mitochondrial-like [Myxocyprinus asiaticus]|uniref:FAST kinase domain-containing protein 5, mitochondrial-like n=1 Tax=Myxocyprinus asiaticus TaxID=70543 RepID=UPI00222308DE|nr:FAST kinase domain-containing protein 5, mitochondrial-like [Myxocyprinus asiaticus]
MSATVLFFHVAKRRLYANTQRFTIFRAQHLPSKGENGEQKGEEKETQSPEHPTSILVYNPSAYYQTKNVRALGRSYTEEPSSNLPINPAFRQQSNPYSISSSRRLSSAKNTLLNLAFSKAGSIRGAAPTPYATKDPGAKGDPRAFQRCRPEYLNMTHDVSQRSLTIDLNEASLLLHKVTVLKGNMEPSDVANFLCKLGQLPHERTAVIRGDTRFNMLLRYSVESLQNFTHAQLLDVLRAFVNLGLPHSHSILGLFETEFCRRASEMELHQLLLAADLWRCLGRFVPRYLEKLFDSITQYFNQIGPPELVQLVYVVGEGRRCPDTLIQPIESLLMRHLNQLMAEELGAVCLSLFKSQISLSERAVRRLVDRTHVVVKDMSDFGIVNVMKLMRFSYLDHLPWLEAMGLEVPRRAPQMGVQGLMHVVLACSALHYRNDRILLAVAEQLPNVVEHCRSKDVAKMLWAFGTLGFLPSQCPNLYPSLTKILCEREAEFQRFPEHLLTGLLGLAFVGQFPHDLLNLALSTEFVNKACNSLELELRKDLFTLDGTVGLELPRWTGPRLSHAMKEEVTKQLWDFAQADICQKPEVLEAESMLQKLLGGEWFVRKHMIFPHLRSIDLEVHLDHSEEPLPVSSGPCHQNLPQKGSAWSQDWEQRLSGVTLTDDLLAQLTNTRKTPVCSPDKPVQKPSLHRVVPIQERESIFSVGVDLTDDLVMALTKSGKCSTHPDDSKPSIVRLAVQVTNRNQYCYRSQQLLGLHALKRRQLMLAGYRVVELPHWEWFPLLRRSQAEKLAYLHCKIFSCSDSKKTDYNFND